MKAVALVTGVTGMVGAQVALNLSEQGHLVFGLARRAPSAAMPGREIPWAHITCDLREPDRVAAVVRFCKPDVIIHAAGAQGSASGAASRTDLYGTNVDGTLNLLEAVHGAAPTARVVIASSGACYGPTARPRHRWTEEDALRPASLYAASKAAGDLAAHAFAGAYGLDVVVARLFNLLGPARSSDSAPAWFARQLAEMEAGLREPILTCGNLRAVRDFLDCRDASAALCSLALAPLPARVYNVCSGRGTSLGNLARRLIRQSAVRRCRLHSPGRPCRDRLVGNPALFEQDIGWRPAITLDQALADLLQFWRKRVQA